MENLNSFEPLPQDSITKRIAAAFIAGIRFVGNQLAVADLNPHEGKLRGSIIPRKYIDVPDYPQFNDDTL